MKNLLTAIGIGAVLFISSGALLAILLFITVIANRIFGYPTEANPMIILLFVYTVGAFHLILREDEK